MPIFSTNRNFQVFFFKNSDWFIFFLKLATEKKLLPCWQLAWETVGLPPVLFCLRDGPFRILRLVLSALSVQNNFILAFANSPAFFYRLHLFCDHKQCCCFRYVFSCFAFCSAVLPFLRFFCSPSFVVCLDLA